MDQKNKKKVSENTLLKKDVLEYLSKNPEFINNNLDLLNKMFALSKKDENIITFENIRIKSLINENILLKDKLKEIVKTAKDNKEIQEKLSKFSNEVISFRKVDLLINYIEEFIDREFPSIKINFNLIKLNGFNDLGAKYFSSNKDLINTIFLKKTPILLTKAEIKLYSLEKFINNKNEALVVCPLGIEYPVGIIFVTYKSEMMGLNLQFDLLSSLTETISYSLEQYIQR